MIRLTIPVSAIRKVLAAFLRAFGYGGLVHWLDGLQFTGGQVRFAIQFKGQRAEIVADVSDSEGKAVLDIQHVYLDGVDTVRLDRKALAQQIMDHVAPYSKFVTCVKSPTTANLEFSLFALGHPVPLSLLGIVGESMIVATSFGD